MDALYIAQLKLQRREYENCISICSTILAQNPYDQAAWFIKVRALTLRDFIDDTDMEEQGIADIVMDENSIAKQPRPGTSLQAPMSDSSSKMGLRPMTGKQRPLTGFIRPSTSSKAGTGSALEQAFQGHRAGTSRPVSVAGRYVRLGTQTMLSGTDAFIDPERLDIKKYVRRSAIAKASNLTASKALCDYLFYVEHAPKKALELCSAATVYCEYKDWWWKSRLGKAYYQLGMLREAQQQFHSAIKGQNIIATSLELAKIFIRLDQPNSALDTYLTAMEEFPGDTSLIIGCARVCEELNDVDKAISFYKKALTIDSSNVEAIASLASFSFYTDQPEIALRYYRRLLQMGVCNSELWNNIGLCCFYSSQYDMTLGCFERALMLAEDDNMAEIWYNIGQVAIGIGDVVLAEQCFKIAVSVDSGHAESYNNLGVLAMRRGNKQDARSYFESAGELASHIFEPLFNAARLAHNVGDLQTSYGLCQKALDAFPEYEGSQGQLEELQRTFLQN